MLAHYPEWRRIKYTRRLLGEMRQLERFYRNIQEIWAQTWADDLLRMIDFIENYMLPIDKDGVRNVRLHSLRERQQRRRAVQGSPDAWE